MSELLVVAGVTDHLWGSGTPSRCIWRRRLPMAAPRLVQTWLKLAVWAGVLCALLTAPAFAQRFGEGPFGGDRGDRGERGERRGGGERPEGGDRGNPQEMMERRARFMEEMLRRSDANGNGYLEAEEMGDGRRRQFAEQMIRNAGIEPQFPIAISRIREATMRQPAGGFPGMGPPSGPGMPGGTPPGTPPAPGAAATPKVPGFGVPANGTAVRSFGGSTASKPTGASSSSSSPERPRTGNSAPPSDGSDNARNDEKVRSYAKSLLKQYDKNQNGTLERDEFREMRGDMQSADRDGDGVITQDELTSRLVEYGKSRDGQGDSSRGGRSRSSDSAGSNGGPPRSSYRFLTAAERLPKGIPDWFTTQDANGDGQVSMAEYSSTWSNAKVTEFVRYDANNDGLITPPECLAVEKGRE